VEGEEAADRGGSRQSAGAGDEGRWSLSPSSVSSIAVPSSSSEGRWLGRGARQASIVSVSSRGRSGRSRRSGRTRPPIARAVAAGAARRYG
jgi:hypothetical protein